MIKYVYLNFIITGLANQFTKTQKIVSKYQGYGILALFFHTFEWTMHAGVCAIEGEGGGVY